MKAKAKATANADADVERSGRFALPLAGIRGSTGGVDYLRLIDRSKTLFKRSDVTPIFADAAAWAALTRDLAAPFREERVACVAGLDALGFVIGAALAVELGVGFVPVRKGGKLPVQHERATFRDYSGDEKTLELRSGAFPAGTRVLLADEWVETGTQMRAAVELVERAGGAVAGITAIAFRKNERTASLWARYRCHAVWPEQV